MLIDFVGICLGCEEGEEIPIYINAIFHLRFTLETSNGC